MFEVCPTYTDISAETTTPLADSGINDRLVKLRPLIHQTCFEFIDVKLFCSGKLVLYCKICTKCLKIEWSRKYPIFIILD